MYIASNDIKKIHASFRLKNLRFSKYFDDVTRLWSNLKSFIYTLTLIIILCQVIEAELFNSYISISSCHYLGNLLCNYMWGFRTYNTCILKMASILKCSYEQKLLRIILSTTRTFQFSFAKGLHCISKYLESVKEFMNNY